MALSELKLLEVINTLVRLVRTGVSPAAALTAVEGAHGREARAELARLVDQNSVSALGSRLASAAAGPFAPPVVAEAAGIVRDPKRLPWLLELGRLASQ